MSRFISYMVVVLVSTAGKETYAFVQNADAGATGPADRDTDAFVRRQTQRRSITIKPAGPLTDVSTPPVRFSEPAAARHREKQSEASVPILMDGEQILEKVRLQATTREKLWEEKDLVVVPAVFKRWGASPDPHFRDSLDKRFSRQPSWAYEDHSRSRKVFIYQRLWEDEPFFVPNFAYEGTIYLRFILDHYDNLPSLMMFVQDDVGAGLMERADCLRRENFTHRAFGGWVENRGMQIWRSPYVEHCWRDFAEIFKLPGFVPRKEPTISFHSCNYFAVGRASILRRPKKQWEAAYKKAISPKCHDGPLNLDQLSDFVLPEKWNRNETHYDLENITKDTSGGALEHLSDMIYGFYDMNAPEPEEKHRDECDYYMPRSQCPASPCNPK